MKKILLSVLWVLLLIGSQAYAQNRTVTGTVTGSNDGQPLPGVTVVAKGSRIATQTGINGNFSINVPAESKTLVISFVGYESAEVPITGNAVRVSLTPSVNSLNDVVVVGYGTQQRRDVTSAVSSVKGGDVTNRATPSFDRQLAGKATGVQVITPSGLLGQPAQIRIRGVASINSGSGPLYVIDGVPAFSGDYGTFTGANALGDINPDDIESFEVLKDGAATAIYGSRAAGGVILVTTKRGKAGQATFSYNGWYATALVSKRLDLLDANQFIEIANERLLNASNPAQAFPMSDGQGGFVNTKWQDYLFRRANQQNHSLSVSGGNDKTKYFASLGYSNQTGVIETNSLKKVTLRANIDHKINKYVNFGFTSNIAYQDNQGPLTSSATLSGNIFGGARMLPNVPVYDPNDPTGYFIAPDRRSLGQGANLSVISDGIPNQRFVLDNNTRRSQTYRIVSNAYLEANILSGLKFRTQIAEDIQLTDDFNFTDPRAGDGFSGNGATSQAFSPTQRWNWQNILSYNKSFSDHNFDVTLVHEMQKDKTSYYQANISNISDPFFNQNIISGTFVTPTVGGSLSYSSLQSLLARVNYNYKGKYYIGGSVRRDELSILSPDNRVGYFPGASVAYRVSNESFWKESKSLEFISDFRIKASIAETANTNLPGGNFPYLGSYAAAAYGAQSGIGFNNTGNPDLKWERQLKYDAGVEFGFFGGRANLTFDYYRNNSKDLVLSAPTSPSLGIPGNSITRNVGGVRNSGIELQLSGDVVRSREVTWNSTINFTTQKNIVTGLVSGQDIINTYNIVRVGESINALYGYQYEGVNAANGNPLYRKANGQIIQGNINTQAYSVYDPANPGVIGANSSLSAGDRSVLGTVLPKWFGGFNNTVTYKNFDANVFLRYSGGNKIYNRSRVEQLNQNFVNNGTEILGRWVSAANPGDGQTPRQFFGRSTFINQDAAAYTRFVEKGDFLRMDNLAIGYKVPVAGLRKIGVTRLRVYASAQNLFVITGYKGLDPETNTTGAGVDYNGNPQQRTYTFGVNLGF
jgi:TonB-linked SusC/RagA family outer membrane protein